MSDCRACEKSGTLRLARPKGVWEERILGLLRIFPVRCVACGARRLRFDPRRGRDLADPAGAGQRPQVAFLEADGEGDFDELVEDIRSSERRVSPGSGD